MEVADVGQACGVSLSTIKRRLRESEARVGELAMSRPTLARFVEEGGRWAVAVAPSAGAGSAHGSES